MVEGFRCKYLVRILITGFNRFGNLLTNPTEIIIEGIMKEAQRDISNSTFAEILSTEYNAAGKRIQYLIRKLQPEAVICLGVAPGTDVIRLERVALNLDDENLNDNADETFIGKVIIPGGPVAYWSTLPIEHIYQGLRNHNIPAVISNHAGTYVCNHVFYLARHQIESMKSNAICGFIHIPQICEQLTTKSTNLSLDVVSSAIKYCLKTVGEKLL